MHCPVHRGLACTFNHCSIALGFSDFHLWCASLKPPTPALLDPSRLDRGMTGAAAYDDDDDDGNECVKPCVVDAENAVVLQ